MDQQGSQGTSARSNGFMDSSGSMWDEGAYLSTRRLPSSSQILDSDDHSRSQPRIPTPHDPRMVAPVIILSDAETEVEGGPASDDSDIEILSVPRQATPPVEPDLRTPATPPADNIFAKVYRSPQRTPKNPISSLPATPRATSFDPSTVPLRHPQPKSHKRRTRRRAPELSRDALEWEWDLRARHTPAPPPADWHCAAFFPYPHFPGLEDMDGVCAIVGGPSVQILPSPTSPPALASVTLVGADGKTTEDLYSCAWSVDVNAWPYVPILAVAGKNASIYVFRVINHALVYDRTIFGHGEAIHDLKFSASHPHLLVSGSLDGTIRLWDPTIVGGSDRVVRAGIHAATKQLNRKITEAAALRGKVEEDTYNNVGVLPRPAIPGELLGILAIGGDEQGVLSVDIHPILPLVVSSGADGKIRIWRIPPFLLGLSWPLHPHALRPPPSQTLKPPTLGPPIFSSRYIHDGVWPDQVVWASDASCHIVSKSSGTDEEGRPTKVIKMWSPGVLHRDLAPLDPKDDVKKREKERSTRESWEADNDGIRQTSSILDDTTPLDYSVLWQIVLPDQNHVGDTFAIHRRPLFKKCDPESETTESFIAVAAMVDPPSILTYRISQHPDSPSYERTGKEDWGPPQLLPSSISPEVNKRHYRTVAVSPEGGKWMIAVGQEGSIAYWRRIKKK